MFRNKLVEFLYHQSYRAVGYGLHQRLADEGERAIVYRRYLKTFGEEPHDTYICK